MAERQAVLTMTPSEEAALARLIGFLCKTEVTDGYRRELSAILGYGSPDVEAIGRINAALNANR